MSQLDLFVAPIRNKTREEIFDDAVEAYMKACTDDYIRIETNGYVRIDDFTVVYAAGRQIFAATDKPTDHVAYKLESRYAQKWVRIETSNNAQRSIHSFIQIEDDSKGKFKRGDILKAASWKAPAKNFARGNIFNPKSYNAKWTGA